MKNTEQQNQAIELLKIAKENLTAVLQIIKANNNSKGLDRDKSGQLSDLAAEAEMTAYKIYSITSQNI
jgi:hypothetical protein